MTDDLQVEADGDDIIITLPGTSYVVTYYRSAAFPRQLNSGHEEERALMTQAEFFARAWCVANDKAYELGWIA